MLIRPISKRNGLTFTVSGAFLICISLFCLLYELLPKVIMAGLLILGLVILVIGIRKLSDTFYRFSLTEQGIHYFTRSGGCTILWKDIQRIDIPKIINGTEEIQLPYIGLRLSNPRRLISTASLPMLAHMLIEQRALVQLSLTDSDLLEHADTLLSAAATDELDFKGLHAQFLKRMTLLHKTLGYDFYFPTDDIDRSPEQFVNLLRTLKRAASNIE